MAELHCKDGTVIKISEETENEIRKAFGHNIPEEVKFGDVFCLDDHRYMLCAVGSSCFGFTGLNNSCGCWNSAKLGGPYNNRPEMRRVLIERGAKYMGNFEEIYKEKL